MEQTRVRNLVGDSIRRLRNARGWTQAQLAAKCEVFGALLSRGTLAKVEARIRGTTDMELFVLSKVLHVPIESLFPKDSAEQVRKATSFARKDET